MICYKGKSYCVTKCGVLNCDDALAPQIVLLAAAAGLPVDMCKNKCGKYPEPLAQEETL